MKDWTRVDVCTECIIKVGLLKEAQIQPGSNAGEKKGGA